MIIEKIELENFMCYSGRQTMKFTEGINVIVGDNGYGKSKLYDAFYWALYDQIFVTEQKKFLGTSEVRSKVVSDKAIFETKEGKVAASVKIIFHDLEKDSIYILRREFTAWKENGALREDRNSELTIQVKGLPFQNAKMITDREEMDKIIEKILPAQIKPYLWFQGEQVESIIDFNQQDTLTRAINVLSSITRYDEIKTVATLASKTARTEYDREVRRLSNDAVRSQELEKQRNDLEVLIERHLKEETEIKENLSRAEEKRELLANKSADAHKVTVLQQKKKDILDQLEELNKSFDDEQIAFHRKMFRNKWVLKGTRELVEIYSKRYDQYDQQRIAANIATPRLPIDVPEPIYLQRMLDQERCLVCDREAKKGTEPYDMIAALLHRSDNKSNLATSPAHKQNFSTDFKRLYQNGLSLAHRIDDIDEDIADTLNKINNQRNRIKTTAKALQDTEKEIENLLIAASINADQAQQIDAEYYVQNEKIIDFVDRLARVSQKLESFRNELRGVNDQLRSLVKTEIPAWLTEKQQVLSDFEIIAFSTRDRVFSNLIQQLETEANRHYEAMTAGNKSARGRIKLKKLPNQNYMPEIIDEKGSPLLGSNTSNLILVKLAAIMAIVSAKSSAGIVDFYTLITDAPTSVFGEDYTIGFCKTISKVYKQSIVMSKEFYKNQQLQEELLNNPEINVGKVYVITPSIRESERINRNTLSTTIETLK